jgi:hypothetical protein
MKHRSSPLQRIRFRNEKNGRDLGWETDALACNLRCLAALENRDEEDVLFAGPVQRLGGVVNLLCVLDDLRFQG